MENKLKKLLKDLIDSKNTLSDYLPKNEFEQHVYDECQKIIFSNEEYIYFEFRLKKFINVDIIHNNITRRFKVYVHPNERTGLLYIAEEDVENNKIVLIVIPEYVTIEDVLNFQLEENYIAAKLGLDWV